MPLVALKRFLIKIPRQAWERAPELFGGETEPLFENEGRRGEGSLVPPEWFLNTPSPRDSVEEHPWEKAHAIAGQLVGRLRASALEGGARVYVEPDLVHRRLIETTHHGAVGRSRGEGWPALKGLDPDYPPSATDDFELEWHLKYAGFRDAWAINDGARARIAHLDTGYFPRHLSTPVNMKETEGRNYYKGDPTNVVDPGNHLNAGHGTATLALLAGKQVDLAYQASRTSPVHRYTGVIGGAPGAAVVPVRIGGVDGSVIHLYSSSMAKGLHHALGDVDRAPCDVVSLSHGGLPTKVWAEEVNHLYDHGIVVAAASGDNFNGYVLDIATHFTVYPAAWWRVITVTGETFARRSYTSKHFRALQGCWGPAPLMKKSMGAYTPNVPWMRLGLPTAWEVDGSGTSAATPQVAAACALWLSEYKHQLPNDWRRVEACRTVLFHALKDRGRDTVKIGVGALDAAALLTDRKYSSQVVEDAKRAKPKLFNRTPADRCSWPLLRLLLGLPPPDGGVGEMLNVEAQQVAYRSRNPKIQRYIEPPVGVRNTAANLSAPKSSAPSFADEFLREPDISSVLREHIRAHIQRPRRTVHKAKQRPSTS